MFRPSTMRVRSWPIITWSPADGTPIGLQLAATFQGADPAPCHVYVSAQTPGTLASRLALATPASSAKCSFLQHAAVAAGWSRLGGGNGRSIGCNALLGV